MEKLVSEIKDFEDLEELMARMNEKMNAIETSRPEFIASNNKDFDSKYEIQKEIYSTQWYTVKEVVHKETGMKRALKIIYMDSPLEKHRVLQEVLIFQTISYEFLVT